MNPDTLSLWWLPALGILVVLVIVPTVVLLVHSRKHRPKYVTQDDFTDKFEKVMTSTNEATRIAREAFTTSVAALDATNLTTQDTRRALTSISSTIGDQHDDLKNTLVKAMEDSRAVNRAVVTAVEGLVDHTREELSVSRSTANDMAEAVKALKSISNDFNHAVVTLRTPANGSVAETDELSSAAITEDLSASQVTGRVGNPMQARAHKASQPHLRDVSLQRGPLDTLPNVEEAQQEDTTVHLAGRLGRVEVAPGAANGPNNGSPQPRPVQVSDDVRELLQLYAGAFADLVAAYQRSRPLTDREIVELAGTYCTTWISRLQSLHERRVPAEVWQRFYMHAIALQTVNDFRSRLQGAALRLAAELWDRQTRNVPAYAEVFRKIGAEIRRQVGELAAATPSARLEPSQSNEYLERRVS